MPGPSPTSKSELQKRGSWRAKDRDDDLSVSTFSSAPKPPARLTRGAKEEWRKIAGVLFARGVLTTLDLPMLEQLCKAVDEERECVRALAKLPLGSAGRKDIRIERDSARKIAKELSPRFGMSPADRTRVREPKGAAPDHPQGKNKSRFFGGAGGVIGRVGA